MVDHAEVRSGSSLKEIAEPKIIDNNYVSRMVDLTSMPPDAVAAFLLISWRISSRCLSWWRNLSHCGKTKCPSIIAGNEDMDIRCSEIA